MNNNKSDTIVQEHLEQLNWNSVQSLTPRNNNCSSFPQSTDYWILTHSYYKSINYSHYSSWLVSLNSFKVQRKNRILTMDPLLL
jgi:hypothetical protein